MSRSLPITVLALSLLLSGAATAVSAGSTPTVDAHQRSTPVRARASRAVGPQAQVTKYATKAYMSGQVALDLPEHRVYALPDAPGVDVLDTRTKQIKVVKTGRVGLAVVADHTNGLVYVTNSNAGTVSIIKGVKVRATVPLAAGAHPDALALSSDGDVYVAEQGSGAVAVIRGTKLVTTVPVGGTPIALAVDGPKVFVADLTNDKVADIQGTTVVGSAAVGVAPRALAADPSLGVVYVADSGSDQVSVINAENNTVQSTVDLPTGTSPDSIAVESPAVYDVGLGGTRTHGFSHTGVIRVTYGQVDAVREFDTANEQVLGVTYNPSTSYLLTEVSQDNQVDPLTSFLARGDGTQLPLGRSTCCGGAGAESQLGHAVIWSANHKAIVKISLPVAPKITITRPKNLAKYSKGQRVTTDFHCTSTDNDVSECATVEPDGQGSGDALDTRSVGEFTFLVKTRAGDGQTRTRSVHYFVLPRHHKGRATD
jgi:YVTN family beta-propeller protein